MLDSKDRLFGLAILFSTAIVAVLEVAGVGVIFWFLSVLANPDVIAESKYLGGAFALITEILQISSRIQFLMLLGGAVLFAFFLRNVYAVVHIWLQQRFLQFRLHKFSNRLLMRYVTRSYLDSLALHSGKLSNNLLNEVQRLVKGLISPTLDLIVATFQGAALIAFLIWQQPVLTLIVVATLGVATVALFEPVRRSVARIGKQRLEADEHRFRSAAETFGGHKEIRLFGAEDFFVERFRRWSQLRAALEVRHKVLSALPNHGLEILTIGGLLSIVYVEFVRTGSASAVVAVVALYAATGYRLIPAIRTGISSVAEQRFSVAALDSLAEDLADRPAIESKRAGKPTDPVVDLKHEIVFDNVTFRFPATKREALREVSLAIPFGGFVALVGETGSGKSTFLDLLSGLLTPTSGSIRIGEIILSPELTRAWCATIGFVPQHIFLLDESVRRNIAFGIRDDEIDDARVRRAARLANIDRFIEETLPNGYETAVGERGSRLSGGELQRLGIARALYRQPSVLILDEPTSALDGTTEHRISESLAELKEKMTVVITAHRLSTIRSCDRIFLLKNGRLAASGSYDELIQTNQTFRRMAHVELERGVHMGQSR